MEKGFNYARFYGIVNKGYTFASKELGEEFKKGLVSQFTDGRTTSLREMTRKEYDTMCDTLEGATARLLRTAKETQRRHRSRCLKLMQQAGIDTTDWQRINDFCRHPKIAGKVFAQLNLADLNSLQTKLRAIIRKGGLRAAAKPNSTEQGSSATLIVYPMYNMAES